MSNQINKILIWSDNFPKRCCVPLILEIALFLHSKLYYFSYVLLEIFLKKVSSNSPNVYVFRIDHGNYSK